MPRCPQITHTGVSRRGVSQVNGEKERCGYNVFSFFLSFSSNHTLDFEISILKYYLMMSWFPLSIHKQQVFFFFFFFFFKKKNEIKWSTTDICGSWTGAELKGPLVPTFCYQLKAPVTHLFFDFLEIHLSVPAVYSHCRANLYVLGIFKKTNVQWGSTIICPAPFFSQIVSPKSHLVESIRVGPVTGIYCGSAGIKSVIPTLKYLRWWSFVIANCH